MNAKIIPIMAQGEIQTPPQGYAHRMLRLYQVFVNVEGVQVPIRHPLVNMIPWRWRPTRHFGLYAVLMLASEDGTKPPMLLSMTHDILADTFAQMSKTRPEDWAIKMEQWREVGVAPPMFQQPGCVDDGWGAAWYEMGNDRDKGQRYRLAKVRLWKGRRAKPGHVLASSRQPADSAKESDNICDIMGRRSYP